MFVLEKFRLQKSVAVVLSLSMGLGQLLFCRPVSAQTDDLNFKVYSPDQANQDQSKPVESASASLPSSKSALSTETAQSDANVDVGTAKSTDQAVDSSVNKDNSKDNSASDGVSVNTSEDNKTGTKVLQGYVKIVPTGTKIPIVMDTAVDSDTSQEGDEFSARTVEDLTIDGTTVIPAGSIIRGRIATLNSPKHLNRSGSVALKFDTVTTPDNRQIPLVANLVARGGVVHARRGMKDIAIDSATFGLPTLVALGIGAVAGHSSSSVGVGGGALIGAGVGAAIGLAILLAKKGKKVDVRPGDELKIELAEDLHMPAM